jgi:hypothetical protein
MVGCSVSFTCHLERGAACRAPLKVTTCAEFDYAQGVALRVTRREPRRHVALVVKLCKKSYSSKNLAPHV